MVLNYLKLVEVDGGDDQGLCGAGIFNDGSGYHFSSAKVLIPSNSAFKEILFPGVVLVDFFLYYHSL